MVAIATPRLLFSRLASSRPSSRPAPRLAGCPPGRCKEKKQAGRKLPGPARPGPAGSPGWGRRGRRQRRRTSQARPSWPGSTSMCVKMEGDAGRSRSRRSPVIEYHAIPRYGPASPFKGHLSTKSNAFCIDSSSRRLTSQYLIRDHMAVHYNKILSAKAAVDCSVPKSRLNSIKFSDQQRREKLKKEVEKCEKEMISSKSSSQSVSRESRRPLSATYRKETLQEVNARLPVSLPSEQKFALDSLSTPEEQSIVRPFPEKPARNDAQKTSNISCSSLSTSSLQRLHSKISSSYSSDSIVNSYSQKTQNAESKILSGDLLDKHSEHFTNAQQPFTPRTLKSDAKPFLLQYRYYMPARRKIKDVPRQVEAETQTDVSSFQVEESEKKSVPEFEKFIKEVEDNADKSDKIKAVSQFSSRVTSPSSVKSPTMKKIQAEEEELLYLSFIQDITDEILKLGLFSNRALEKLFERHIEQNKNRLDETKMRHLLEILKVDLGCSKAKFSRGTGPLCMLEHEPAEPYQLPSKGPKLKQLSKSKEFLKAMDLMANEPDISSACGDEFKKVEDKEQLSNGVRKTISAGQEPSPFVLTEETEDTLSFLEPAFNSTPRDADFETSDSLKEIEELQESLAESLRASDTAPQQITSSKASEEARH